MGQHNSCKTLIRVYSNMHLMHPNNKVLQLAIILIQWNLYTKDNLGAAVFVLNREVSSSWRLKIH